MNVTCQKYGDPTTRQTFAYDDDAIAVADHYIARFFPETPGAVTLVEVVEAPVEGVGVWRVEDLGRILGRRALLARRATPVEIDAVASGDAARIRRRLAPTTDDKTLTSCIQTGVLLIDSLLALTRFYQHMVAMGERLGASDAAARRETLERNHSLVAAHTDAVMNGDRCTRCAHVRGNHGDEHLGYVASTPPNPGCKVVACACPKFTLREPDPTP